MTEQNDLTLYTRALLEYSLAPNDKLEKHVDSLKAKIQEQIKKAEKWDNAIKEGLVFGDKEWVLDSIYQLKQENKDLESKLQQYKSMIDKIEKFKDEDFD